MIIWILELFIHTCKLKLFILNIFKILVLFFIVPGKLIECFYTKDFIKSKQETFWCKNLN